jgi:hypothetical protein
MVLTLSVVRSESGILSRSLRKVVRKEGREGRVAILEGRREVGRKGRKKGSLEEPE